MKKTQEVDINDVHAGAVLAADVVDGDGRVLMSAGAALSDAALASLRRREIASLSIEVVEELDAAAREARRVRIENQLARLFRHAGEDTETRALLQTVLAYRLKENS